MPISLSTSARSPRRLLTGIATLAATVALSGCGGAGARPRRRLLPGIATPAATVALSGCGGSSPISAAAAAPAPPAVTSVAAKQPRFNAADVTFAQQMIPHHREALSMATLAVDQAASKEV